MTSSSSIPGAVTRESELERLSAAATPGEWRYSPGPNFDEADIVATAHGYPAELGNFYCATGADEFEALPGKANCAFIVALVNAYRSGELIAAAPVSLSGGEERKQRLIELLGEWIKEDQGASASQTEPSPTVEPLRVSPADAASVSSRGPADKDWRTVMRNLISEHDKNVCLHEETHRGGFLWTICDQCGRRWADDQGGFKAYEEPAAVTEAWALLNEVAEPAALGTEARSAETFGLGPKDDGPATTLVATPQPLPLLSEQKHREGRE